METSSFNVFNVAISVLCLYITKSLLSLAISFLSIANCFVSACKNKNKHLYSEISNFNHAGLSTSTTEFERSNVVRVCRTWSLIIIGWINNPKIECTITCDERQIFCNNQKRIVTKKKLIKLLYFNIHCQNLTFHLM